MPETERSLPAAPTAFRAKIRISRVQKQILFAFCRHGVSKKKSKIITRRAENQTQLLFSAPPRNEARRGAFSFRSSVLAGPRLQDGDDPAGPTFGRFQPGCPSDLRFGKSPENSAPYSDEKHHSLYFIAFLSKNDKNYLFCRSSLLSLPHRRLKTGRTPPLRIQQTENGQKTEKNLCGAICWSFTSFISWLWPQDSSQLRAPRVVESGDRLAGCVRRHSDAGKTRYRATHLLFWRPGCRTPRATKLFSR